MKEWRWHLCQFLSNREGSSATLSLRNASARSNKKIKNKKQKTKAQAWFLWMLEACMLTSSRSGDADSVDRQSFLVLFRVREMYPWAFCPACHLVPLWSLLHTLCPIWAAGLGKGEKNLLQAPNCIKLSNKALLSLKEKRIKNSCYIYSGQKRSPIHT